MEDLLYVDSDDLGLPTPMTVDDTGTMTLHFRVTSVSKNTDMETGEETEGVRYTLQVEVQSTEVDDVELRDALNRSIKEQNGDSPVRVKTQVSPSPA